MGMGPWIRLVRPVHIVKNLFVLLPAPFAAAAEGVSDPLDLALGFAAFSLVPFGGYALNDAIDAERDRHHPKKRHRPVASGQISRRAAVVLGVTLIAAGLAGLAVIAEGRALPLAAAYFLLNLVYTLRGKHVPVLDVLLLASGFLLRIAIGCRLIDVPPSNWLLVCGSSVAVFLALGKRRADLSLGLDVAHRPSLAGYSRRGLDRAMELSLLVTLGTYALYTTSSDVFIPARRYAGLPFAGLALLAAFLRMRRHDDPRSPIEVVLRSPWVLLALAAYWIATAWSLGGLD